MNHKHPHIEELTGGYILVPLEPTKDMLLAGSMDLRMGDCIGTLVRAAECWKAMVAAAPQQKAQERVYLVNTGVVLNGLEMYERHEKPVPLADCEVVYTAPQPAAPQAAPYIARLTKPAKVGGGTYCAGVPERLVIEAAQRLHEHEASEPKASPEELMTQEAARRNLWDMLHGPLPTAGNHPALPPRPQVADALLAEVAGNFTREDDLPNELLRRIDAYLTSEGYTE
jgi:hypothetical protein